MKRFLRGLVGFLLLLLILPLILPIPPLQDTQPLEHLLTDGRLISVGDLSIHTVQAGDGPHTPLLLLHGFAASTRSWNAVLSDLAVDRRALAFDRPGFGLTERPLPPGEPNPYSNAQAPHLTLELMDATGVDAAIVIGHSAGGAVALHTALTAPERVEALVLVAPAIYTQAATLGPFRTLLSTPQMGRLGPWLLRGIARWGDRGLQMAWGPDGDVPDSVIDDYRYPLQAPHWDRGLWEVLRASISLDLSQRLHELDIPLLIITGDADRIIPPAHSYRLAEEVPGSTLVVFENTGHLPHEEDPQRFVQTVLDFLATLETSH